VAGAKSQRRYSELDHLIRSIYLGRLRGSVSRFFNTPHDRPPTGLLMITLYLDESEHSTADKYMAVGGFYGNDAQWCSFASEWKHALGSRKALHMRALRINAKPKRAKRLMDSLGPLPYKHGLKPICSAVKFDDYVDLLSSGNIETKKAMAGYPTCLNGVLIALNKLVPAHESIKIVCEDQKQYADVAMRIYRATTMQLNNEPENPYFSGIEFIPKNSSILTQPADCLAYAVTHWLENPKSQASAICRPILGDGRVAGYKITRQVARDLVRKTESLVKKSRLQW
jgi:hypothetical protein